jgi:hypothetical protein
MKRLPHHNQASKEALFEPTRLMARASITSQVLREAADEYGTDLDERGAWDRLEPKLGRRSRGLPLAVYAAYGFAAGLVFLLLVQPARRNGSHEIAITAPLLADSREPPASVPPADESFPVAPPLLPQPLLVGQTRLTDGSIVRLAQASHAAVSAPSPDRTTIDLSQGTVELEVAHQTAGHRLEVVGGPYRFVALGTQFRVTVRSDRVVVEVIEGTVGVLAGVKELARVEPGGSWTGAPGESDDTMKSRAANELPASGSSPRLQEPTSPTSGALAKPATANQPDCANVARSGQARDAIACFERQAEGDGMSAELALYEIARLRKDVLSDFSGALEALRKYEARFPRGSLRGEVKVSILELLERLGRNDEALSESARLLETAWGKERALEIHLLRGNIYRQATRDFARAEAEYAHSADDSGPSGDEAQFLRAFCLERLGRAAEAAGVYEVYLRRSHPRHAVEAKARLQALSP